MEKVRERKREREGEREGGRESMCVYRQTESVGVCRQTQCMCVNRV